MENLGFAIMVWLAILGIISTMTIALVGLGALIARWFRRTKMG